MLECRELLKNAGTRVIVEIHMSHGVRGQIVSILPVGPLLANEIGEK